MTRIHSAFNGRLTIILLIIITMNLASCGLIPGVRGPGDVANDFYSSQSPGSEECPPEVYIDESLAEQVRADIDRRESTYGAYISHKRIGSNKQISIEAGGRKESVIYIFEVTCENGRTRETLMIRRSKVTKGYRIISYEIEEVPRTRDLAPPGTSST